MQNIYKWKEFILSFFTIGYQGLNIISLQALLPSDKILIKVLNSYHKVLQIKRLFCLVVITDSNKCSPVDFDHGS